MGWKLFKDYFAIKHIVQITDEGICIGSPYNLCIIIVGMDGAIAKRYRSNGSNPDLARYQFEIEKNGPEQVKGILEARDAFERDIQVYTFDNKGNIVEKICEKVGWPNVTHDGLLMYENRFSEDRDKVVLWAKSYFESGIENMEARIAEIDNQLQEFREIQNQCASAYRRLLALEDASDSRNSSF